MSTKPATFSGWPGRTTAWSARRTSGLPGRRARAPRPHRAAPRARQRSARRCAAPARARSSRSPPGRTCRPASRQPGSSEKDASSATSPSSQPPTTPSGRAYQCSTGAYVPADIDQDRMARAPPETTRRLTRGATPPEATLRSSGASSRQQPATTTALVKSQNPAPRRYARIALRSAARSSSSSTSRVWNSPYAGTKGPPVRHGDTQRRVRDGVASLPSDPPRPSAGGSHARHHPRHVDRQRAAHALLRSSNQNGRPAAERPSEPGRVRSTAD